MASRADVFTGYVQTPAQVDRTDGVVMRDLYVLDERGEPERCSDRALWERWYQQDGRRVVRQQHFVVDDGALFVVTVFVGRDQRFYGNGPPLLWQTTVFDEGEDPSCEIDAELYSSRADAIAGHDHIVAELGGPRQE